MTSAAYPVLTPPLNLTPPLAIKYWPQTTVSWLSLYDLANLQTLHRLNCKQKHDYDLRFDRSLLRCDWVERVAVVDAMSWMERFALPAHWRRLTSLWEMLAGQSLEDNFIQCCFLVSGPGDYVLVIRWDVAAQNWRRFLWLQTTHTEYMYHSEAIALCFFTTHRHACHFHGLFPCKPACPADLQNINIMF